ncbi:MAG: DUF2807 domain-containing protein [Acidobacteria bacterium]|nr:DUF2807 domain-containing protein [Acidobacteriota bacterium]
MDGIFKKYLFSLLVVSIALFICVDLNAAEKTFKLDSFDRVGLSHGVKYEIKYSEKHYVEVTINDKYIDNIEVIQKGSFVEIGLEDGHHYRNTDFSVVVYTDNLTKISTSGGAAGSISGFDKLSELAIHTSGGSHMEFEDSANLKGALEVHTSGGSVLKLKKLTADGIDASMSGGSVVYITLNDGSKVDAHLSGGSRIYTEGKNLDLNVKTSGGSRVINN